MKRKSEEEEAVGEVVVAHEEKRPRPAAEAEKIELLDLDDHLLACVMAVLAQGNPKDAARLAATCRRLWAIAQRADVWARAELWRESRAFVPKFLRNARKADIASQRYEKDGFGAMTPQERARAQQLVLSLENHLLAGNFDPMDEQSDETAKKAEECAALAPLWAEFKQLRSLETSGNGFGALNGVELPSTIEQAKHISSWILRLQKLYKPRAGKLPNIREAEIISAYSIFGVEKLAAACPRLRKLFIKIFGFGSVAFQGMEAVFQGMPQLEDLEMHASRADFTGMEFDWNKGQLRRLVMDISPVFNDLDPDEYGVYNYFNCRLVAAACPLLEVLEVGKMAYDASSGIGQLAKLKHLHTLSIPIFSTPGTKALRWHQLYRPRASAAAAAEAAASEQEGASEAQHAQEAADLPAIDPPSAPAAEATTHEDGDEEELEDDDEDGDEEEEAGDGYDSSSSDLDLFDFSESHYRDVDTDSNTEFWRNFDEKTKAQLAALVALGSASGAVPFRSLSLFYHKRFHLEEFFATPRCHALEHIELEALSFSEAEALGRNAGATLRTIVLRKITPAAALLLSHCAQVDRLIIKAKYSDSTFLNVDLAASYLPTAPKVRELYILNVEVDDEMLAAITKLLGPTLERFAFRQPAFTKDGWEEFNRNCPQLRLFKEIPDPMTIGLMNSDL